jgi:hypothetical protein
MAEDRPVTPEKQLLKLIEDPKATGGATRAAGRARGAFSWAGFRGVLAGRLSFWKRAARTNKPGRSFIDLVVVNRALALAAVALLGYVSFDAAASVVMLGHQPNITIAPHAASAPVSAQNASPLKESAFYLEKVAARDIFKEGPRAPVAQKTEQAPAEVEDASGQFSLVGISWSSNPDVIIENKTEQRTYFVKRGQPVGSNTKVEAVFKDHVILSREGREFEIR